MTVTLDLPPEIAERLNNDKVAQERARMLLVREFNTQNPYEHLRLLASEQATATKRLFEEWAKADSDLDKDQKIQNNREAAEIRQGLNANRAANGERLLFLEDTCL
ncbi:MAG: hypothetical protein OHK0029_08600 [Armatimonadaceae bacterium]